jgi:hypothetical protein
VAGDRLPYVDPSRESFVRCRTLGHSWFDYDSNWKSEFGMPLTVRCERCGMERRDTVAHATGELVARHYTRPDGYAWTQAPTRSEFRLLLLSLRKKGK